MSEMTRYEEMDNAALVERLCHAADDGAMYYLIFRRLNGKLCDEMARYGIADEDAFATASTVTIPCRMPR